MFLVLKLLLNIAVDSFTLSAYSTLRNQEYTQIFMRPYNNPEQEYVLVFVDENR